MIVKGQPLATVPLVAISGGFLLITGLLLWISAFVYVDATRVLTVQTAEQVSDERRVDVRVQRRIFGLIPIEDRELTDVVTAAARNSNMRRTGSGARSGGWRLELTRREGQEWASATAMYVIGTGPEEMAPQIQAMIDKGNVQALSFRWIPWISTFFAVPFLVISLLFVLVWVNAIRGMLTRS